MPIKDPEKRREANRLRMRKRRAEGTAWDDPEKDAERKAAWYQENKERLNELQRKRRAAKRKAAKKKKP